ncbi:MAG: glycosyltransferase family 9 protein [Chlamydiia bacterium]|nr:glycosyltransferase family 9 protein [Chlamydiia bacterium]
MKNTLIKTFLKMSSPRKNRREGEPRILIVSTTGLGDSLWGSPAVRALRKKFPKGYLALLTSPIGEELFRNSPHLNDIFVIKDPPLLSSLKILSTLRKKAFDTALIFHLSQRPILPLVYLAGPSTIIGTEGINKGLDDLLTHPIPPTHMHEIERRLMIADCEDASPKMELFLTEEENLSSLQYLPEAPLVIGMHPGAKDRFKQWDPKHFIALGRRLAKEKNATIVITGNKKEIPLAKHIATNIPRAVSVAGKLSVRHTAALIEKFDYFITNDTGPMHLAFAMETPTLALFSPTDPTLCGPYKITYGVGFQKPSTCTPCIRKKCRSPFCMEQISPDEVYERINL